jgi:aminopeptidase N
MRFGSPRLLQTLLLMVSTIFFTGLSSEANAQRLPLNVKPVHYTLELAPDLTHATFTGRESIDVTIAEATDAITLNAAEIKFEKVTAVVDGKTLTAKVSADEKKEQATLDFGQKLAAGKLRIEIRYTGILNNELRGFYLSKTAKRNYAVTQFESTDARRAFPSFDEPALKATFSITLIVDKGDTAISNTNIIADKPSEGGAKHSITFAETPRMSSYLVAFLVGDFQCLSGSSDGVPIRSCATPDQVKYGAFALSSAEYILHYYNQYFGIKYPMPKLDMIAIPDFEAGAMENFGAITYRESDMLLDASHASVDAKRNVALVVAHEMAHQWFGDMVTLEWWNNTWLNEGFATWMENKPVEAWKPEWNITQQVASDNQGTLNLDARRITHAIRANADTPDEINEMFDGISYGKAGAMLLMVENYLGEEAFRAGVHKYLSAHLYGNATAEDFWNTLAEVSHKPVDKIMDSLVSQAGVPLLTFGDREGSSVAASQQRFYLNSKDQPNTAEVWTILVCFKAVGGERCELLTTVHQSLAAPSAPLFYANAAGKGYFRSSYPESVYRQLVEHVESDLTPEERISLIGDQWALMRSGRGNVGSFLELTAAMSWDSNAAVLNLIATDLRTVDAQIAESPEDRAALASWVRAQFTPAWKKLGAPQSSDSPGKQELRAELLELVGGLGQAPDAIAEAKEITAKNLADAKDVDPTLASTALNIAARNGDEALFAQLQNVSEEAGNAQVRADALRALGRFHDPVLEKRALDYAVSGRMRNQDVPSFVANEIYGRETQDIAWQFVQENWEKVKAQLTTFGGAYVVGGASGFCSASRQNEVTSFFNTHKVSAAEMALARTKDLITDCIDLRAAQGANLKPWLAAHR